MIGEFLAQCGDSLSAPTCAQAFNERPVMTYEEIAIVNFLKGCRDSFVARREIARKAQKRTIFEENPHWADAPLSSLVDQRVIEQNDSGHYQIKKSQG